MTDTPAPPVKYASFNARVIASSLDLGLVLLLVQPLLDSIMERMFEPVHVQHIMEVMNTPGRTTLDLWHLFMQEHVIERTLISNLIEVFFIALYILPFWLSYSTTPGKMITRIQIRDAVTGEPMTRRQSVIRFSGYIVSAIPLSLGFLWILTNKRRRGWHDYIAGTVVIVKPRGRKAVATPQNPVQPPPE